MHKIRGMERDKPVKEYGSTQWRLTGRLRGPWWGRLTPPWRLQPLWSPSGAFLPLMKCSYTDAFCSGCSSTPKCVFEGGSNDPSTLGVRCALSHGNQDNIKCRGSTGGNTPAEPQVLLTYSSQAHKLHDVKLKPTCGGLTARTHTTTRLGELMINKSIYNLDCKDFGHKKSEGVVDLLFGRKKD